MKIKCENCKKVVDDFKTVTEPHGEPIKVCCKCNSDKGGIAVVKCRTCGENYADAEIAICENCLSDINVLLRYGDEKGINYFLNYIYDDDVINSVLKDDLKQTVSGENTKFKLEILKRINDFVNEHKYELAEFLKEDKNV